jgi:hypothetical protein
MIANMRATAVLVLLVSVIIAQGGRSTAGSADDWADTEHYRRRNARWPGKLFGIRGSKMLHCIYQAIIRARFGIMIAALADVSGLVLGVAMVHTGNSFALRQRDRIVNSAQGSSVIVSLATGDRAKAALLDTAGHLWASVGATLAGSVVVPAGGLAFYRGWVGGIVSVDDGHRSRLTNASMASYYLVTVLLQSVPYILAVGAGISIGLALLGPYFGLNLHYGGPSIWPHSLRIPRQPVTDALWIYMVTLPLMFIASVFEFFI